MVQRAAANVVRNTSGTVAGDQLIVFVTSCDQTVVGEVVERRSCLATGANVIATVFATSAEVYSMVSQKKTSLER